MLRQNVTLNVHDNRSIIEGIIKRHFIVALTLMEVDVN